nr:COX15/CtaA family protein [Gemmatimonadaceae bacterium]
GVLRVAAASLAVVVTTALFGALTVFMGNPPHATVAHWVLAAALFALLAATVIRAGGLGGEAALSGNGSSKTVRGALAAVGVALLAIALGGLTAKVPFAAVACPSFPLCGQAPAGTPGGATHIQLAHRILAFLLFFHLLGIAIAVRRRTENVAVQRAAWAAFGATLIQLLVAAAMIGMRLPPVPRALHQAMGVLVWITTFILWYLAHRSNGADGAATLRTAERMPLHSRPQPRSGA